MRFAVSSLIAIAAIGTAHADNSELVTAEISYEPALLKTEAGATEVLDGIVRDAREACRVTNPASWLKHRYDQACVDEVTEKAVTEINVPSLTIAFNSATGKVIILADN